MSSGPGGENGRLDASGPREVVYCHQCENEWYRDEHGLVCPRCDGEITEIISADSDPRPQPQPSRQQSQRELLESLHEHHPWEDADSDPEEADIEEHITHGPGGSVLFSRTVRSTSRGTFGGGRTRAGHGRRDPFGQAEGPDVVMRDFQNMVGSLMGSQGAQFRPGQAGRSGPDTLFTQGPFGLRLAGNGPPPNVVGGRFTFTTTGGRPRNANGGQPGDPDDLATYIGNLFGAMGAPGPEDPHGERGAGPGAGMPPGLAAMFTTLLNPANARSGDAVYTQEALDQIISTLMEQHPTSNAPGPAPADAIAALPKKKLDYEMLGPEGKGECSVCMDDVTVGVEVVVLPCSHWFHEACAGAWLGEHNTCPICRKGLETAQQSSTAGSGTPSSSNDTNNRRSSASSPTSSSRNDRSRRLSAATRLQRMSPGSGSSSRNEARLDSIRDIGRLSPTEERTSRRWGEGNQGNGNDRDGGNMPGAFHSSAFSSGRRPSEMSENQRDARRGNTSGSDRSRRSSHSQSGNSGGGSGGGTGGAMSWLRDRWGSGRRDN